MSDRIRLRAPLTSRIFRVYNSVPMTFSHGKWSAQFGLSVIAAKLTEEVENWLLDNNVSAPMIGDLHIATDSAIGVMKIIRPDQEVTLIFPDGTSAMAFKFQWL